RVRGPFNVSSTAQAMGLAALLDTDFTEQMRKDTIETREWTAKQLHGLGITTTNSVGNFILMSMADRINRSAAECDAFLKADGVIVRPVAGYGLPDWLRVSIGTKDEMQAFITTMKQFLEQTD
ncbi:MAG: aminotransferase class I/II-fold pyridoxal phosphate-dependent enzyme, partial [Rhodospirillales bacterium]|nr:aminotransferase class I/II-fold pyridoxal phosphate-dependent enzyme [Rhodospirillales bacterium]